MAGDAVLIFLLARQQFQLLKVHDERHEDDPECGLTLGHRVPRMVVPDLHAVCTNIAEEKRPHHRKQGQRQQRCMLI